MKNIFIAFILLTWNICYCNNEKGAFVDKCYFSEDGNWALISELYFVRPERNSEKLPVFGLYRLGVNEINNRILISDDSIYFFNKLLFPVDLPISVDSVFDKQSFFKKFHFNQEAINVTEEVKFKIQEKFIREENTIKLYNLDQFTGVSHSAENTKYFDYFIDFKYNEKVFFRDTLLNSFADKQHLLSGLNEKEKKKIYSDDEKRYIGTKGYGTRIYANIDKTLFFIRAKYDINNYVVISAKWLEVNSNTGKEEQVKRTVDHFDEPKELRVLLKLN